MGKVRRFWLTYGIATLLAGALVAGIEKYFDDQAGKRVRQLSERIVLLEGAIYATRDRMAWVQGRLEMPLNPGGRDLGFEEEVQ